MKDKLSKLKENLMKINLTSRKQCNPLVIQFLQSQHFGKCEHRRKSSTRWQEHRLRDNYTFNIQLEIEFWKLRVQYWITLKIPLKAPVFQFKTCLVKRESDCGWAKLLVDSVEWAWSLDETTKNEASRSRLKVRERGVKTFINWRTLLYRPLSLHFTVTTSWKRQKIKYCNFQI